MMMSEILLFPVPDSELQIQYIFRWDATGESVHAVMMARCQQVSRCVIVRLGGELAAISSFMKVILEIAALVQSGSFVSMKRFLNAAKVRTMLQHAITWLQLIGLFLARGASAGSKTEGSPQ